MCNCTSGNDEVDDLTYRHADRTDRDPDVVAAGGADGGDGQNPGVSTGGDDVRDRRAGGVPDLDRAAGCRPRIVATAPCMDRRGRWSVRLSRTLFSGAAFRASGRSRVVELSLAAADRAVFVAAAGRTAGAAPYHRRRAWTDRHGALVCGQQQQRVRARSDARIDRGVRRRLRVGILFGDVAQAQIGADRRGGGLLSGDGAVSCGRAWGDRGYGLARYHGAMAGDHCARSRTGRCGILCLGYRDEARRYPCPGCRVLCDAAALDGVSDFGGFCQAERRDREPLRRGVGPDRDFGYRVHDGGK